MGYYCFTDFAKQIFLGGVSQQSMSMPIILVGVVGVILGLFVGYLYRKQVAEKEIGSAEQEATAS